MCIACSALPCICDDPDDPDDPCRSKAFRVLRAARSPKGVGK